MFKTLGVSLESADLSIHRVHEMHLRMKYLWEHKGNKISLTSEYFRKGTKSIDQFNCVVLCNRWRLIK